MVVFEVNKNRRIQTKNMVMSLPYLYTLFIYTLSIYSYQGL